MSSPQPEGVAWTRPKHTACFGSSIKSARRAVSALRKLNEKNLSNLTPHPLYSGFYYSHPTLLEREQALGAV
jgi:Zn-dependent protease with chaperone function